MQADPNADVRGRMVDAGILIIDKHGRENVTLLFPIFENFLNKKVSPELDVSSFVLICLHVLLSFSIFVLSLDVIILSNLRTSCLVLEHLHLSGATRHILNNSDGSN